MNSNECDQFFVTGSEKSQLPSTIEVLYLGKENRCLHAICCNNSYYIPAIYNYSQ